MQIKLRHMAAGLAVAALLPLGLQAQGSSSLKLPHEQFKLPNGLTVILHQDRTLPLVSVNTWYYVGSGFEKPGRTGFAHLFEHIMFEGSKNVKEGDFDNLLEAAGGDNNGSTNTDRTNYFENVPSNALDLPLFLESDRLGYLLDSLTQQKLDGQRDVVKNERRQSYENRPYGLVWDIMPGLLYPKGHPYSWSTIGSMDDLSAASLDDVKAFFRTYYIPNNAVVTIAGDFDLAEAKKKVTHWFSEIPAGKPVARPTAAPVKLDKEIRYVMEDRVQLPRLYLAWHSPASYAPGDAELSVVGNVLAGGPASRLYKKLVYELQIAQDVSALQNGNGLGGTFLMIATARPGVTLDKLREVIDAEIASLRTSPPTERELQRVVNQYATGAVSALQSVQAKADILNSYLYYTGEADYLAKDLARFDKLTPKQVQDAAATYLVPQRVVFSVVPQGKPELGIAPVQ